MATRSILSTEVGLIGLGLCSSAVGHQYVGHESSPEWPRGSPSAGSSDRLSTGPAISGADWARKGERASCSPSTLRIGGSVGLGASRTVKGGSMPVGLIAGVGVGGGGRPMFDGLLGFLRFGPQVAGMLAMDGGLTYCTEGWSERGSTSGEMSLVLMRWGVEAACGWAVATEEGAGAGPKALMGVKKAILRTLGAFFGVKEDALVCLGCLRGVCVVKVQVRCR